MKLSVETRTCPDSFATPSSTDPPLPQPGPHLELCRLQASLTSRRIYKALIAGSTKALGSTYDTDLTSFDILTERKLMLFLYVTVLDALY